MAPGSAAATTEKQKTLGSTAADKDPAGKYWADGEGPLAGYMAELLCDENSKKRNSRLPCRRRVANSNDAVEQACHGRKGYPQRPVKASRKTGTENLPPDIYAYCMSFQVTAWSL
jgi:hypothetical protein